ncbi:hypothetical protein PBY51_016632 [Eleginops maclovinus]|uniref:Uncharacterized protein n=1 Tax=Eleginops maclovinus TaxID=56733 RepID=A0AAN7WUM9_ELEMC|nr:hypothetical protein PBY51_016632 [Eleginops maclovinus]
MNQQHTPRSLNTAAGYLVSTGSEWKCIWEKEIALRSVCPRAAVLIGGREPVAGNGGPSRLRALPGDGHYRWHSMAVSAAIFTPQASLFMC